MRSLEEPESFRYRTSINLEGVLDLVEVELVARLSGREDRALDQTLLALDMGLSRSERSFLERVIFRSM